MKNKTSIKLPLSNIEKANLKRNKVKIADILNYAPDELEVILNSTPERVKEIYALAEFQTVPSIGVKFAKDLVFLGYYSLNDSCYSSVFPLFPLLPKLLPLPLTKMLYEKINF